MDGMAMIEEYGFFLDELLADSAKAGHLNAEWIQKDHDFGAKMDAEGIPHSEQIAEVERALERFGKDKWRKRVFRCR